MATRAPSGAQTISLYRMSNDLALISATPSPVICTTTDKAEITALLARGRDVKKKSGAQDVLIYLAVGFKDGVRFLDINPRLLTPDCTTLDKDKKSVPALDNAAKLATGSVSSFRQILETSSNEQQGIRPEKDQAMFAIAATLDGLIYPFRIAYADETLLTLEAKFMPNEENLSTPFLRVKPIQAVPFVDLGPIFKRSYTFFIFYASDAFNCRRYIPQADSSQVQVLRCSESVASITR